MDLSIFVEMMATTWLLWIILLALTVLTIIYLLSKRWEELKKPVAQTIALENLEIGDLVEWRFMPNQMFRVSGIVELEENGWRWKEIRLTTVKGLTRWLSVEYAGLDKIIVLWEEVDLPEQKPSPEQETIAFEGKVFQRKEHGFARATLIGDTGRPATETCEYADYESEDGQLLAVERWGDEVSFWKGKKVSEDEFTIYRPEVKVA